MAKKRRRLKRCRKGLVRDPITRQCVRPTVLARSIDELVELALEQESSREWYSRSQAAIRAIFGEDTELFVKLLAATSPRASVASNVSLALKAYTQLINGEEFTGFNPSHMLNLERVRSGAWPQGPKVGPFGQATMGNPKAITIDMHMGEIIFGTDAPTNRQVRLAKEVVEEVRTGLGWEPAEAQAALWAANKMLRGEEITSFHEVLEERIDEIDALRAELKRTVPNAPRIEFDEEVTGLSGIIGGSDGAPTPRHLHTRIIEALEARATSFQNGQVLARELLARRVGEERASLMAAGVTTVIALGSLAIAARRTRSRR